MSIEKLEQELKQSRGYEVVDVTRIDDNGGWVAFAIKGETFLRLDYTPAHWDSTPWSWTDGLRRKDAELKVTVLIG